MNRMFLIAGVAALAVAAPASAQGQGKGNGGDKRAQSSKVERGGGGKARAQNQKANRQQARSGNRQRAQGAARQRAQANRQDARSERVSQARAQRQRNARAERQAAGARQARAERQRQARAERQRQVRAERQREVRAQRQAQRRTERVQAARSEQLRDRRQVARRTAAERQREQQRLAERSRNQRQDLRQTRQRVAQLRERNDYRYRGTDRGRDYRRYASRGLPAAFVNGCPPGLAKQNQLCLPPGQYRKAVGQRLPADYRGQRLPSGLRDYYRDTDDYYYRYGDGYLYRVDRDRQLVSSVLPLIGAGLGIGMPFPYNSPSYHVPSSYQSFYPDTPYSYHRYANGYVYEIDRNSGLIDDMVPLLDQGYGVGQMLPSSYSYYNVPDPYRSWYQDDDDYLYRYAPGAIYQVDRDTQLITAIVSLLTGSSNGLAVGQPLPTGYDMYNVPYDYRDRYYDTPDSWYRYSNGNIYQVDPTTRLITAVVDAIV